MANPKYEYKFVTVELDESNLDPKMNHQALIERMAAQGWRFVQIFSPPPTGFFRDKHHYEVIFERPVEA